MYNFENSLSIESPHPPECQRAKDFPVDSPNLSLLLSLFCLYSSVSKGLIQKGKTKKRKDKSRKEGESNI
jgi:hypothetical protein